MMVSSLGTGGAERAAAILSTMLVDAGYDVTIISILDHVVYSYKGRLINLERMTNTHSGVYKRWQKFMITRRMISNANFDYIIDGTSRPGWWKQWCVNTFIYRDVKTVFLVHSYQLRTYFPKVKWLGKQLYRNAYQMVGVSRDIVTHFQKTYGLDNGVCIHNAYNEAHWDKLAKVEIVRPAAKYIIAYGRIDTRVKNHEFLIKTYAASKLGEKGVQLCIMGDGPDKDFVKRLVVTYGIENKVVFIGFSENPFPYVKNALFATLTSNYEGFPMVLIESLAMGVPVVSVDCNSGPSEIIVTGENGILVPFNNAEAYVTALNTMIEDTTFYKNCKKGTIHSVSIYKTQHIIPQWKAILPVPK